MKLETKIEFESNLLDGTRTDWMAQPYRLDDDSGTVWVHVVDKEGKVVFEMLLDELEELCKALRTANIAEMEVEREGVKP